MAGHRTPFDDVHVGVAISDNLTFTPGDYVGPGGDQVQLRFVGVSDGAWSDEDCLYDSNGLAQVDNIVVAISGGPTMSEDFEDGTARTGSRSSTPASATSRRSGATSKTSIRARRTPAQVAFIDDGIVVPGTGGTSCITWCYGPNGYIVNNTGGLPARRAHIDNVIFSPVLEWPAGDDGAVLAFDVFVHEDLIAGVSPGIFYQWHMRSTVSTNPDDITAKAWEDLPGCTTRAAST